MNISRNNPHNIAGMQSDSEPLTYAELKRQLATERAKTDALQQQVLHLKKKVYKGRKQLPKPRIVGSADDSASIAQTASPKQAFSKSSISGFVESSEISDGDSLQSDLGGIDDTSSSEEELSILANYDNNRLDTDESGNSIFIDIMEASNERFDNPRPTYSTAGYDHTEEELMDVMCVEADWSKLKMSKELENLLKQTKQSNKGNLAQKHSANGFTRTKDQDQSGASSRGSRSNLVSSSNNLSNTNSNSMNAMISTGTKADPFNILRSGINAKGIHNSITAEFLESRESRRKLERQRELFRLPARESWRYVSDQPPCANIREFCFPNGVVVQYVSKNAAEYLVGEQFDRYHLVQLTGSSGQAAYACVLTVTKIVSAAFAAPPANTHSPVGGTVQESEVLSVLEGMMALKKPARVIRSFMRRLIKYIKKQRWDTVMHGTFTGHMGGAASHNESKTSVSSDDIPEPSGTQPVSRATRMMQMIADATGGRHHTQASKQRFGFGGGSQESIDVSPAKEPVPAAPSRTFGSLFGGGSNASPAPAPAAESSGASSGGWGSALFGGPSRWGAKTDTSPTRTNATTPASSSANLSLTKPDNTAKNSKSNRPVDLLDLDNSYYSGVTDDMSDSSQHDGRNKSPAQRTPQRRQSLAIISKNLDANAAVAESINNAINRNNKFEKVLKSMPPGIAGLPMTLPSADDDGSDSSDDESNKSDGGLDTRVHIIDTQAQSTLVTWDSLMGTGGDHRSKDSSSYTNSRDHKCIVSEVAYCLVSSKPIQALGFKILKEMADAERNVLVEGGDSGEFDPENLRRRTMSANSVGSGSGKRSNDKANLNTNVLSPMGGSKDVPYSNLLIDLQKTPVAGVSLIGGKMQKGMYHSEVAYNMVPMQLSDLSYYRNAFLHRIHQQLCRWSALGGLKLFLNTNFSSSLIVSKKKKPSGKSPHRGRARSMRLSLTPAQAHALANAAAVSQPSLSVDTGSPGGHSQATRLSDKMLQTRHIPQELHAIISGYIDATPAKPEGFVVNLSTLPSVDELSAAVMFSYLNSSIIFKLINLLLMEKSLVICGKHSGIVSNVALAVKNLILPFRWEGVFVPLVPDSARELFGAPVPFILGTTISPRDGDVSPSSAILYLHDDESVASSLKLRSDLNVSGLLSPTTPHTKTTQPTSTVKSQGTTTKSARTSVTSDSVVLTDAEIKAKAHSSMKSQSRLKYLGRSSVSSANLINQQELSSYAHSAGFSATLPETVAWFIRLPDSMNADMPHDEQLECMIDDTKRYLQRSRATYCAIQLEEEYLKHRDAGGSDSEFKFSRRPTLDVQYLLSMTSKEQRAVIALVRSLYEHNMRFCGDAIDPTAWRRYVRYNDVTGEEEFYPNWFMEPVRRHVEFQEAVVQTQLFVGFMDHVRAESAAKDRFRQFIREWVTFRLRMKMKKRLSNLLIHSS